jgi:DNA segregation ATPase FtsK/SpoIIIE, S-DNA-T family
MPEPVRVSVSEVRREIYGASGFAAGDGQPSNQMLGILFHKAFRALMRSDSDLGWANVLDADSLGDFAKLREHAYETIIGPYLRQNQAALQSCSQRVVTMWEATGHLCEFVCRLLTTSFREGTLRFDPDTHEWRGADQFSAEEELSWLVEDDDWTAPVLVSGIVDAVWRNPSSKRWCALELKLGAGAGEADLAQLCLYHEMLRSQETEGAGQISLFHFQPTLTSSTLTAEQIEPVQSKLRALVGRIAGVSVRSSHSAPTLAHRELGARLVQVLEQFGPMVALESDPVVGPAFLRFHIMPKPGVKVDKILPLGRDLGVQLRLSRPALIRLEGGMLVIDVQRPDREKLSFAEFRPLLLPRNPKGNARVLVGVDLNRQPRFADMATECPHMLVAGTTSSGKSEWLLTALASLADTNTPRTLQLMLIDPKGVTLSQFHDRHFLLENALLTTPDEANRGLKQLIDLMEERYQLLSKHACTDLAALQTKVPDEAPPRIVCFCDEYGNLVAKKKDREQIELSINQLGAKARAAGVHLIVATQDPRAQIVSPILKANLGGRVCLRTVSALQSRMILEENGAESLLGQGDLLFKITGEPLRLQAPLLGDPEREEIFGRKL